MKTVRVAGKRKLSDNEEVEINDSNGTANPETALVAQSTALSNPRDQELPAVIVVESADHVCFPLPRNLAFRMLAVQTRVLNGEAAPTTHAISSSSSDDANTEAAASAAPTNASSLFFPDINSTAMRKVVEYVCYEWQESEAIAAANQIATRAPGSFKPAQQAEQAAREEVLEAQFIQNAAAEKADPTILTKLSTAPDGSVLDLLPRPDESMLSYLRNSSSAVLCELASASFYLDVKPLVEMTCRAIAGLIRGKSAEEIRETFSITNDFTPAEEEAVGRSIVERAMLLPASVIDSDHAAHALLSNTPLPKPPVIETTKPLSRREKLRSKMENRALEQEKELASIHAQLRNHNQNASQAVNPASLSVDELMELIEEGDSTTGKGKKKVKKQTSAVTSKPAPSATNSNPPTVAVNTAPTSSLADLLDDIILGTLPSTTTSAQKKKKKAKKKKNANATTSADESKQNQLSADENSSPPSPSLGPAPSSNANSANSTSAALAASSALKNYSSSAIASLMQDADSLAALLGITGTAEDGSEMSAAAQREKLATLQALHTSLGPSHPSFQDTMQSLLQSLSSLESYEHSIAAMRKQGFGGSNANELEEDDDETFGTEEIDEKETGRSEMEKFEAMLASSTAATGATATTASAQSKRLNDMLSSIAAASENSRKASAAGNDDGESSSVLLPDAQLSRLIDAKLNGLAHWEESQQQRRSITSSPTADLNAVTTSAASANGSSPTSLDSFASYMCTCPPNVSARAAAASENDLASNTLPTTLSGVIAEQFHSATSASAPSSPSLSPSSGPSSLSNRQLPELKLDPVTGSPIGRMVLCAHCGLFQLKNSSTDDSQLNLQSPSKGKTNSLASPLKKKSAVENYSITSPSVSTPSASAAKTEKGKAQTTPAAAANPAATSSSSTVPATAAANSATATSNVTNSGCSNCTTVSAKLVADHASLQQRLSSLENNVKQEKKSLHDRLKVLEKFEMQLKTQETLLRKSLSEERTLRTKNEELNAKKMKDEMHFAATSAVSLGLESVQEKLDGFDGRITELLSTHAQSVANANNESKQRFAKISEKIASLEKSQSGLSANFPNMLKEELEKNDKKLVTRLEKLIAKEVSKQVSAAVTAQTAALEDEKSAVNALSQRVEAQLLELKRNSNDLLSWQSSQQMQMEQALNKAMQNFMAQQQQNNLLMSSSNSLPSHYSSASLHSRPPAGTGLPLSGVGVGSSLNSVFSSTPSLPLSGGNAWQAPPSSAARLVSSNVQPDLSSDSFYESSNAVTASLLADDGPQPSSSQPSYFSMFAPPPKTSTQSHTSSTNRW